MKSLSRNPQAFYFRLRNAVAETDTNAGPCNRRAQVKQWLYPTHLQLNILCLDCASGTGIQVCDPLIKNGRVFTPTKFLLL